MLRTSFTGIAASHINGITLHQVFNFKSKTYLHPLSDDWRAHLQDTYKDLKLLIIDEFSMVSPDLFYWVRPL